MNAKVTKYAEAIAAKQGYEVTSVESKKSEYSNDVFWTINFERRLGGNGLCDRTGWVMFRTSATHGRTRFCSANEYQPLLPDRKMTELKELDFWIRYS